MAYGKGKARKDWSRRAVPLGIGAISAARRARFIELRDAVLALMRRMVEDAFVPEPLAEPYASDALDARLCAMQNAATGLNAVWREQARVRVKPALEQAQKRYFRRLAGCLRFCDAPMPAKGDEVPLRRFLHVPKGIEASVTDADFAGLKALAEAGEAVETFRRVIVENHFAGLSDAQVAVLRAIHARLHDGYRRPDFGERNDFTLQLTLDARMLPSTQKHAALELREGAAAVLSDRKNRRYRHFIDLAATLPRAPRLRLPVTIEKRLANRIDEARPDYAAITVELSEHTIGARLVVGKPAESLDASAVTCVIGRDFGYANTVSLAVMQSEAPVDLDALKTQWADIESKMDARAHLETHRLPETVRCIERLRFSGQAFLKRLAHLSDKIDGYRSRIDRDYATLAQLKSAIAEQLSLEPGTRITPEMKHSAAAELVRAFFQIKGRIDDAKRARRAVYRRMGDIKRHWFGFLSNVEVTLAKRYHAAIAREALTVEAIERDAPEYKGRAFNKMINHGARGQYARRAADKFAWHGVPECEVPSPYTSRACLRHSAIVAKTARNGETIRFACCGNATDHADEHAGETIGGYPFLRLIESFGGVSGSKGADPARDKHRSPVLYGGENVTFASRTSRRPTIAATSIRCYGSCARTTGRFSRCPCRRRYRYRPRRRRPPCLRSAVAGSMQTGIDIPFCTRRHFQMLHIPRW